MRIGFLSVLPFLLSLAQCNGSDGVSYESTAPATSVDELSAPPCEVSADCPQEPDGDTLVCVLGACGQAQKQECAGVGCDGLVCVLNAKDFCPDCRLDSMCVADSVCEKLNCVIDPSERPEARSAGDEEAGTAPSSDAKRGDDE